LTDPVRPQNGGKDADALAKYQVSTSWMPPATVIIGQSRDPRGGGFFGGSSPLRFSRALNRSSLGAVKLTVEVLFGFGLWW
jgi:hypothetical protein